MSDKIIIPKPEIKLTKDLKVIKPEELKHILEPGELGATLEMIVRKPNGEITDYLFKKSESFVIQFLRLLAVMFNQVTQSEDIIDTGNIPRVIALTDYTFDCEGAVGVVASGIVVGTDNTAPTINDYALGALIAHGVGAGQLQYGIVTWGLPTSDATTSHFTITRDFANASGAPITVNEVGLYVYGKKGWTATNRYFMAIRDVIAGGMVVPNGETLTVNYRPTAVV